MSHRISLPLCRKTWRQPGISSKILPEKSFKVLKSSSSLDHTNVKSCSQNNPRHNSNFWIWWNTVYETPDLQLRITIHLSELRPQRFFSKFHIPHLRPVCVFPTNTQKEIKYSSRESSVFIQKAYSSNDYMTFN